MTPALAPKARTPRDLEQDPPERYPAPKKQDLEDARAWVKAEIENQLRRIRRLPALPREH